MDEMQYSCKFGQITNSRGNIQMSYLLKLLTFLVFFAGAYANAHELDNHAVDSMTASDVDITSEEDVRAFLEHAAAHWRHVSSQNPFIPPVLEFRAKMREPGGEWRNETTYLIRLNGEGTSIVLHPYYPLGQNGVIKDEQGLGQTLATEAIKNSGEVKCIPYVLDGVNRWACAVQLPRAIVPVNTVFIAGFHHPFEALSFKGLTCPFYIPKTSAVDVVDEETLKAFVDEFAEYYLDLYKDQGPAGVLANRNCIRTLPWKHGSIYLVRTSEEGRVFFHGTSPEFEDNSWDKIIDKEGNNVAEMLQNTRNSLKEGEGAFLDYYWDDPATPDDDVDVQQCPEGPRTCAPGTSLKRTYIKRINIPEDPPQSVFIASGIYLEEGSDGCAIAKTSNDIQIAVLNLLLIFLAVVGVSVSRLRSILFKE